MDENYEVSNRVEQVYCNIVDFEFRSILDEEVLARFIEILHCLKQGWIRLICFWRLEVTVEFDLFVA